MKLKQKNLKPLQLTKETLQGLETPTLGNAQGGNRSLNTLCPSGCGTILPFNCCPHN